MNQRTYRLYAVATVAAMGAAIGAATSIGQPVLGLLAFLAGTGIIYVLKQCVDTPLVDERIEGIAGRAALRTYQTTALFAALVGMVLIAMDAGGQRNPLYLAGMLFAGYAMLQIILYSLLFRHFYTKGEQP